MCLSYDNKKYKKNIQSNTITIQNNQEEMHRGLVLSTEDGNTFSDDLGEAWCYFCLFVCRLMCLEICQQQLLDVSICVILLLQVPGNKKLPVLYLIDSIIKNVANGPYLKLFMHNITNTFCAVFEKVGS